MIGIKTFFFNYFIYATFHSKNLKIVLFFYTIVSLQIHTNMNYELTSAYFIYIEKRLLKSLKFLTKLNGQFYKFTNEFHFSK